MKSVKNQLLSLFATSVIKQAMKGNAACLKEVMERIDGKITDKIERTGKGPAIIFDVKYEKLDMKPGQIGYEQDIAGKKKKAGRLTHL